MTPLSEPPKRDLVGDRIYQDLIQTSEVHLNVRQEYIVTTEYKVHRCLLRLEILSKAGAR